MGGFTLWARPSFRLIQLAATAGILDRGASAVFVPVSLFLG